MKIGIIDADLIYKKTNFPNLALMKISSYLKTQKESVSLVNNYGEIANFKYLFLSKVFSDTQVPEKVLSLSNIFLGGTGFGEEIDKPLVYEMEHSLPDYTLYTDVFKGDKHDCSIGYTTRGCFRKCSFCVNKKYDKAFKASSLSEIIDPQKKYICLLDDNFLAYKGWRNILQELKATNKRFVFKQGLDIRLMTEEIAKEFMEAKYYGDYTFAFDWIKDKELIEQKLKLWRKYCKKSTKFYLLCGYENTEITDVINLFERIKTIGQYACLPFVMRYKDCYISAFSNMYGEITRWCNQPNFFKKKTFRQFCEANQARHKGTRKPLCSAYETLINFEKEYPEIAKKYFDTVFYKKENK